MTILLYMGGWWLVGYILSTVLTIGFDRRLTYRDVFVEHPLIGIMGPLVIVPALYHLISEYDLGSGKIMFDFRPKRDDD